MIDRRDFLRAAVVGSAAGLGACGTQQSATGSATSAGGAAPAASGGASPAQQQAASFATTLSLTIKGQAALLTPKPDSTGKDVIVACLRNEEHDVRHDAWLFLTEDSVDTNNKETAKPDDTSVKGWLGWKLRGAVGFPGSPVVAPAVRVAPLPPPSGSRPADVEKEEHWKSDEWIANASFISPGSTLKRGWEQLCEWRLTLPLGKFTARKPCHTEDVRAIWKFEVPPQAGQAHPVIMDVRAVSDIAVYESLGFGTNASLKIETDRPLVIYFRPVPANGYILCSPPNAGGHPKYKIGDKLAHFTRFYRLLDNPSNAEMIYIGASAQDGAVTGGTCAAPALLKDDDLFCNDLMIPLL